ncbi:MAG: prolyl oligopeptidase family serine peptidase, partial [Caldilineaceae bacterium]
GSFSSAILHRLLRDERDQFTAWITAGGISNAFTGSADFYAGRLDIPDPYGLVIPALGAANIYPVPFLRFSPVYTAAHLPPTLIIHTDADAIIPINQAYQLEAALRAADVPVEVFYYQDVSHYLQIGDDITEAGKAMFGLVMDFVGRYTGK